MRSRQRLLLLLFCSPNGATKDANTASTIACSSIGLRRSASSPSQAASPGGSWRPAARSSASSGAGSAPAMSLRL